MSVLLGLITAGIGAAIGAWANSWWREREARKVRDRELKGIARILAIEQGYNAARLEVLSKDADFVNLSSFTDLCTEAWDDSRLRLTQLLPAQVDVEHENEYLTAQIRYYQEIRSILAIINDDAFSPEEKGKLASVHFEAADRYGKAALLHSSRYLLKGDEDYSKEQQDVFAREAKRLMKPGT